MANIPIFIFGGGAIGLSLAVQLERAGKNPVVVRTKTGNIRTDYQEVAVSPDGEQSTPVGIRMQPITMTQDVSGILVITAKSIANPALARHFKSNNIQGPIILLQNGLGVEKPFLQAEAQAVYRCVIYATAQTQDKNQVIFRTIRQSPIGVVRGETSFLESYVDELSTPGFAFIAEPAIQMQIWKKAIINSVFNSVCPLLEVDNGIFVRDPMAASLAQNIVDECLQVAQRLDIELNSVEIMEQLLQISEGSQGQLISTLQDIQNGRETEIDSLNLEIDRMAAALTPAVNVPLTKALGILIQIKAREHQKSE